MATEDSGWIRAAVLGANDGILSVSSLVLGLGLHANPLLAGLAALTAGAFSMAAGEYVSVSAQADLEAASREKEQMEIIQHPVQEVQELQKIYQERGLEPALAGEVAVQLTLHDAIGSHMRDELGITEEMKARPIQAAFASALSFSCGALVPILVVLAGLGAPWLIAVSLAFLGGLGAWAARAGGADSKIGALRITIWGMLAMGLSLLIGHIL
jgi:vacuolar iron transporter family protein